MFEHYSHRVITPYHFYRRLTKSLLLALFLIAIALLIGMWGYAHYESMSVVDAFVNAAMILSGMGPMTPLKTDAGKIFAGSYALFSGLAFIAILGIILAPIIHRFFHKLHVDVDNK
jgi:hypothetical protein